MRIRPAAAALALLIGITIGTPPPIGAAPATAELVARRDAAMGQLADGILLLHARSEAKQEDQPGFVQDASFYYFTGLEQAPGAVLALDGPRRKARLFVAPPPLSFGAAVPGLSPAPGEAAAAQLGLDSVLPWDELVVWLRKRLAEAPAVLYVDAPRRAEMTGVPAGMRPVAGRLTLWRTALQEAFPNQRVQSALPVLRALRWRKSEAEVAALRDNAHRTVWALRAAAAAIRPGVRQRESEAAVVAACLRDGGQGPSFWPWTMAGPNAHVGRLVRAFYEYEHLDRVMQAGEVVRVDIGCRGHGYGADVGRTLPVTGRFSVQQRAVWDLLVGGYLAGVEAMRAGVSVTAVRAASRAYVRQAATLLGFDSARDAAAALDADAAWHLHGVGIESGEEALPVLQAGTVLAYEPMVVAGTDAFYLEDMILVTETGHEVLSAGLPYRADALEAWMTEVQRPH